MRALSLLPFIAFFGLITVAAAQNEEFTGSNGIKIEFIEPLAPPSGLGRIDCFSGSGCKPLNRAQCGDETGLTREIAARLSWDTSTATSDTKLYVWVQKESSSSTSTVVESCTYDGSSTSRTLLLSNPLTVIGSVLDYSELTFPDDYDENLILTVGDFMNATGELADNTNVVADACSDSFKRVVYRLCFGINLNATCIGCTATDLDVVTSSDPSAYLRIYVYTKPPNDVTNATVTALDSRLRVTAIASGTREVGEKWKVRMRPLVSIADASEDDCSLWDDSAITTNADATSGNQIEIDGKNGQLYEGCVYLVDSFANKSEVWASFVGTPIEQCDFIECYPGPLSTGCNATSRLSPILGTLLFALFLCFVYCRRGVRR
ncbi:MAG: hypothetical protein JW841_17685 [Deltaproteobacteria bacterium]|nr:hypothetical protein [Deltaproteobacteria bacterium]